jgi:copper chaperone
MTDSTFTVTGMTCEHCARAVSDEIGGLRGVVRVDVDLTTGRVHVASDRPLADVDVHGAVAEAGYEVRS